MKTKSLTILIQAEDDKVYQVALAKDHEAYVLDLLSQLHNGKIKLLEQPLEGVKMFVPVRKKPVAVEAFLYDGSSEHNRIVIDLLRESSTPAYMDTIIRNCSPEHPDGFNYPVLKIATLEGDHTVNTGDWIIRGIAGECYPCKPDIFNKTYELL